MPGLTREETQSVADQSAAPSSPDRLLPLTVRLAPHFVNTFCSCIEKVTKEQQSSTAGLLFGVTGESLVVLQSFRALKASDEGPLEGQRLVKAFEQAFGEAQTDQEVCALDLIGWYWLRSSAGLHTNDIEFHNAHFRRPKDVALILRMQVDGDISLEFYSRAKAPRLSAEQHRWGALRLSTDVPVLGPIEVTMRAAVAEGELKTLDSLDRALEGERRKSRGLTRADVKIFKSGQAKAESGREVALERAVPATESNAGARTSTPALLLNNRGRLWWVPSAILVAVFAVVGAATFAIVFLYGLRTERIAPASSKTIVSESELGLRAEVQDGHVLLSWNRYNSVLRSAKGAILHIDDGAQHRDVRLDPGQIDNARVLYQPRSDDVTFRLEARESQGPDVGESVRVLGAAPRPPLDLSATANAQAPAAEPEVAKATGDYGSNTPGETKNVAPSQAAEHREPSTAAEAKSAAPAVMPPPVQSHDAIPSPTMPSPNGALLAAVEAGIAKVWQHRIDQSSAAVSKPPGPAQRKAKMPDKASMQLGSTTAAQTASLTKTRSEEPSSVKLLPQNSQPASAIPNPPAALPPPVPVQAGGLETQTSGIQQPDFRPARPIRQVVPDTTPLPPDVLASSPQVKVVVKIDADGHVTKSQVVGDSAGVNETLANAALGAAKYWTFEPATLGGRRVASEHTIVFQFHPAQ